MVVSFAAAGREPSPPLTACDGREGLRRLLLQIGRTLLSLEGHWDSVASCP